jgi:hypothetical protein
MVEVTISLTIPCQGRRDGCLLSLCFFFGGFHSVWTCWPSPHSLVTIPSRIWCYGADVYDLNHLWVTAYRFPLGHGLVLFYWSLDSWLWWILCQEACFRVGCYYMALHFYQHYLVLGKTTRVMPMCVLGVDYWLVRNLCSSIHSLSYLRSNCHPIIRAKGYVACVSTVLSRRVLTCC